MQLLRLLISISICCFSQAATIAEEDTSNLASSTTNAPETPIKGFEPRNREMEKDEVYKHNHDTLIIILPIFFILMLIMLAIIAMLLRRNQRSKPNGGDGMVHNRGTDFSMTMAGGSLSNASKADGSGYFFHSPTTTVDLNNTETDCKSKTIYPTEAKTCQPETTGNLSSFFLKSPIATVTNEAPPTATEKRSKSKSKSKSKNKKSRSVKYQQL